MRVNTFHWNKTVIASATALALVAGPAFMDGVFTADMDAPGLFPQAYAAQGSGQGQHGAVQLLPIHTGVAQLEVFGCQDHDTGGVDLVDHRPRGVLRRPE